MARSISAAVGIRHGFAVMPNVQNDLDTIKELFDGIAVESGGTAGTGRVWANIRDVLIAELTAQIVAFQTINKRPVIDGVVDKDGGTLREMNRLSSGGTGPTPGGGISATVELAPNGLTENVVTGYSVADPVQMPGIAPFDPITVRAEYTRKLVRVDGSSIKWFGVVLPTAEGSLSGGIPHINFTPTPIQGGYSDATYDSFGGWGKLWDDYTSIIGAQVAASGAGQIVVLPFYKTGQQQNLGDFLTNWREVVAEVVTKAIFSVDLFFLRDRYTFSRIVSSSFSNGWVAHKGFNSSAAGAADMTDKIVDLDGVAGGSSWTPPNGVIYRNRPAPVKMNPVGNVWYVGGRWSNKWVTMYGGSLNTHAASRNHLLYHALR